jgi:hypothetical protein
MSLGKYFFIFQRTIIIIFQVSESKKNNQVGKQGALYRCWQRMKRGGSKPLVDVTGRH